MKFKNAVFLLALSLSLSIACKSEDTPPLITNAGSFEFVWNTLDEHYAYFDLKGVDWDKVKLDYESRVTETMSPDEYSQLLIEMVKLLEDENTGLIVNNTNHFYQGYRGEADNSPLNIESYVDNVIVNSSRMLIGDVIGKNLKYMAFKNLYDVNTDLPEFSLLYQTLNLLADTDDGLIIDLRSLETNEEILTLQIIRYFTIENAIYRRFRSRNGSGRNDFTPWEDDLIFNLDGVRWVKPIVILTNRFVKGSAEDFTLRLKAHDNVTQLGDTTAGAIGSPMRYSVPHGYGLMVSQEQITDPEGNLIEGTGIAPDEVVWINDADRNAGRDTILEAAIAKF